MKFGKEELKKGTDREMEHTDSRKEAAKIAKDHLKEKPDYYTKLDKCIPEETVNEADEHVTIHSPGHRYHGKKARVFHKHDDGRINVQIRHSQKKGDVNNLTLDKGQWKPLHEENIQELSKDTMKNYRKKALIDAALARKGSERAFDNDDIDNSNKLNKIKHKRYKGAAMADKKLKEENIQELSDKTLKSYSQKAYDDFLDHDDDDKKNPNWAKNRINGSKKADKIVANRAGRKNWDKIKNIKEGDDREHGPGDDEDSLDRIERKKMEKSRKAAAKVKAIKMAANKK